MRTLEYAARCGFCLLVFKMEGKRMRIPMPDEDRDPHRDDLQPYHRAINGGLTDRNGDRPPDRHRHDR